MGATPPQAEQAPASQNATRTRSGSEPTIHIAPNELSSALRRAAKVIEPRAAVEAMRVVRIRSEQQRPHLSAVSRHAFVEVELNAHATGTVDCLVSHSALTDAIRPLSHTDTIALRSTNEGVELCAGQTRYTIPEARRQDWPSRRYEQLEWTRVLQATGAEMSEALAAVSIHVSHDRTRPQFEGIYLEHAPTGEPKPAWIPDCARAIGCDAFRLCCVPLPGALTPFAVTLPTRLLTAATAKPGKSEITRLELAYPHGGQSASTARVTRDRETWVLSPIPGEYPSYTGVLPDGHQVAVTVNRQRLLKCVEAACAAAGDSQSPLRIGVQPTQLTLSVEVFDGASYQDAVAASTVGEHDWSQFGIKPSFYRDALRALITDQVEIRLTCPARPLLTVGGDRVVVNMPIRLND